LKDNSNISQELLETVERYYNDTMSKQERSDFELQLDESSEFKTQVEDIKTLIFGIKNLAAAVIILLAVTGFWWFSTPQHKKLYSEYFTPDPGLPTVMSSNSNFEFYDAMVNYKQADYDLAIEKWDAIHGKGDTLNYFLGVAHLANKNENLALSYLESASKNLEFPLIDDTYYYLGLAYLKDGNVEKSKESLEKSTLENSKSLLSKLKN